MGVQTYDEGLLEWLGRPAGASAVCHADDLLDRYWNGSLNRDLLAGLPGNAGRLEDDVKRALKTDPGHLSVYELTIEPGTALAGNPAALEELPEEQERHMEWTRLRRVLADRGYRRYEVSNFARPGRECRHNLAYWTMKPYLGIGPGAVSTLPGPNGGAVRYEEPANLALWLDDAGQSAHQTELSRYEFALEHFMMALRTAGGLSRDRFGAVFGIDPADVVPGSLDKWIRSGSLELTSEAIRPTDDGLDLVDAILADMAEELEVRLPSGGLRWPLS